MLNIENKHAGYSFGFFEFKIFKSIQKIETCIEGMTAGQFKRGRIRTSSPLLWVWSCFIADLSHLWRI